MILCLDVGNSLIHGGVFLNGELLLQFRRPTQWTFSSDEIGIFARLVLRENGIDPKDIKDVAICTVVPALLHSLRNAAIKYFGTTPFVLKAGVKTGLRIKYRNPLEVGADRIANAIAATKMFPDEDLIICDLGTATTLCAVTRDRQYLGGVITVGVKTGAEALEARTAQLPSVEIVKPMCTVGRSTAEGMQAGLYWGTVGMLRELMQRMRNEAFEGRRVRTIGASGLAGLFEDEGVFDHIIPDLVLQGLLEALSMNTVQSASS